jgi:hypothetical protein
MSESYLSRYVPAILRKPYRPLIPRKGLTILYWRIVLCCRSCEQVVADSAKAQIRAHAAADNYRAMLLDAYIARRQLSKGMQRQARRLKRLRAENLKLRESINMFKREIERL